MLGLRALHTFRLTRRQADLSVAIGIAWLATALVAAMTLDVWSIGWWLGHACEIAGIAFVAIPVRASTCAAPSPAAPSAAKAFEAAQLVRSEEEFLGAQVRALMVRLAEKDAYTEDHTRRVALRAVQVGEELGLAPRRLRELAIGGLLHDVGKLSVPNAILQKPGPGRRRVRGDQAPPGVGRAAAGRARRFSPIVSARARPSRAPRRRRLPARSRGAARPRRILTVCDVYDALTSQRVYREAWTQQGAIELLRRESGTAFDPRCVEALERVLGSERPPLALAA